MLHQALVGDTERMTEADRRIGATCRRLEAKEIEIERKRAPIGAAPRRSSAPLRATAPTRVAIEIGDELAVHARPAAFD